MNATTKTTNSLPRITVPDVMRWTGRVTSVMSVAVLSMFLFGGNEALPSGREWFGLALFPGLVVLGFVIAWRKELTGAVISIAALIAFHIWFSPNGVYFALFTLPAVFFLISGGLRYRDSQRAKAARLD